MSQVQGELRILFGEAKNRALTSDLAIHWDKVELPLIFFCDSMIKSSSLPWAGEWPELAAERNETAGDEKFFDLLEETLKDKSPQATQRLTIYYTCIGLGFTGWYTSQPEYLRRKMKEIAARLQAAGQISDVRRICADAYEKVDTRDLVEPPGMKLVGIGVVLVGLIAVLFAAYVYLYQSNAKALADATEIVIQKATPKEASK
jgi:type VI protein secretion system component VasF